MDSAAWHTSPVPFETSSLLAAELELSDIVAQVLARRGYADVGSAREFLWGTELHDPSLFPQMDAACARIKRAISAGKKICVHGDYDVDGVTATAVLFETLRDLNAEVITVLPNRFEGGYGITAAAIHKLAQQQTELLICVDCGITAIAEIDLAHSLGMDVIVVDHHRPGKDLPDALIISPLVCDYPFKGLAGVGLAFKLAQALASSDSATPENRMSEKLSSLLDLVALGTIADVVPLTGENRSLVKLGMLQMVRTRRPGLEALIQISELNSSRLTAGQVAFRLAPRLNAAGRLDDAVSALQLLLTEDENTALELAAHLDSLNRERQRIESAILRQAEKQISVWPEDVRNYYAYVVSSPDWHEGVIGIVASRLSEAHSRPVIVISEKDGIGKGSGRSIPGFDLHSAIADSSARLLAFGGHSAACGLTIAVEQIDAFRNELAAYAGARLSDEQLRPPRRIDALVTGTDLTVLLAEELSLLEPFGMGNPGVELLATAVGIRNGRRTRDGRHFQCQIDHGGVRSSAIAFNQANLCDVTDNSGAYDLAFRLEKKEFNGSVSAQVNIREVISRPIQDRVIDGMCTCACDLECPERIPSQDLWSMAGLDPSSAEVAGVGESSDLAAASGAALEYSVHAWLESEDRISTPAAPERLIDLRNQGGVPGRIAKVLASGDPVLLLTADVARRRELIARLPLAELGAGSMLLAGSRCSQTLLEAKLRSTQPDVLVADFATALRHSQYLKKYLHVIYIDPPPHEALFGLLGAAAPEAWIHLFYCSDEVEFSRKVLEFQYHLRACLTKVYRLLKTADAHPLNETTERLLLSGTRHLRQPCAVARSLRVLGELGLLVVEEKGPLPILTLPASGKTDLESSSTYRAAYAFYEECQKFLSQSLSRKSISAPETTICGSFSRP